MNHEPECMHTKFKPTWFTYCMCEELRAAYQRGAKEEQTRAIEVLSSKVCSTPNCGHTACVAYFNATRLIRGIAV